MCKEPSPSENVQTSDEYDQDNASDSSCCSHYAVDCAGGTNPAAQGERVGEAGEKESGKIGSHKGEVSHDTSEEKGRHPPGFRDLLFKNETEQQQK